MAGRPRKAPNAIAGHRAPRQGLVPVAVAERAAPPDVPRGLLKRSREIWQRFWASELSDHVDRAADIYRVERWIRDVDEVERAWRLHRGQRFVRGSMGQMVLNPAWRVVQDCEARISKAEEQLGMTPLARARLGLAIGEAGNELADLNDRMNEPDEPRGPRAAAIEAEFRPL